MEAFEEVDDTFSGCEGCPDVHDYFSTRMGSLNLSFTSTSFDPAFTFDTSSRSSSLLHCDSSSARSPTADAKLPPAPPLLAVVSASPCPTMRRSLTAVRRTSLPNAPATEASARPCRPAWSPSCPSSRCTAAGNTTEPMETPGTAAGFSDTLRGSLKRRSCQDADPADSQASGMPPLPQTDAAAGGGRSGGGAGEGGAGGGAACSSELHLPGSPNSPASSFASFAAALAAHYYADFGSVPDVPEHLEQARQRAGKRQRMHSAVEQTADV
ncbi:hypothetical protein PLESTB_000480500 [Pleodorina starrii]|uniref:Uncharacterized protein n=1 Tax=Pleodorina starrii TaxID=330485 RepID=A0A9W6BGJ9_9CHLO|nr:hypothetical protein PLESTM_001586000 [Pleodorina starrii]GLC51232.1 hypothetical protein PLESTB_000480500 [Pleodorina starrii]GLC63591.1 hypothetical protein PLESTF_000052900 [Pleodorina starrii]